MASVRPVKRRLISALLLAFILAMSAGATARQSMTEAQTFSAAPTAQDVVNNLITRNAALNSYVARIDIRLRTGIPFLNPTFEGLAYFKQPNSHEVVFTKSPSYAKGFEKLYADINEPAVWDQRYFYSLEGERVYNGRNDLVLRLVTRIRGELNHQDVLVDPRRWVIDEIVYYYETGGRITVEHVYGEEAGFAVLTEEHALIAMPPFPHAHADAHFTHYKINVAIDDSIFTEKQTKNIGVDGK